jgi:hypothetical protein
MAVMWSVISIILVLAVWGMHAYLGQAAIPFNTGQWIIYLLWLGWTLLGLAFVWTFVVEKERRAAKVGILFFGGVSAPMAVILAVLWL